MKPDVTKVYGLTHDAEGGEIIRVPKVVKIQIGKPRGPGIHVWIEEGTWRVAFESRSADGKLQNNLIYKGPDKAKAIASYEAALASYNSKTPVVRIDGKQVAVCIERKFPTKLHYFTFSHPNGDGTYSPDFDAIEKHGSTPTEIDIVMMNDDAFWAQYQAWTAKGLACTGDGRNALRSITADPVMLKGHEAAIEAAKASGSLFFPIVEGCKTFNCKFAKSQGVDGRGNPLPPACKIHGRLQFQLIGDLRLGGTGQFDTTSEKTVLELASCISVFKRFTSGGRGPGFVAGIPVKLKLNRWKHTHGHAFSVSLELRAESIEAMNKKIMEQALTIRGMIDAPLPTTPAASTPPARQLEAPGPAEGMEMVNEFDHGQVVDDVGEDPADTRPTTGPVETATSIAAAGLAEKLAKAKEPKPEEATPEILDAEPIDDEPLVDETVPADVPADDGTLFPGMAKDAAVSDQPAAKRAPRATRKDRCKICGAVEGSRHLEDCPNKVKA